jgi:signal transduction histidine kinase
VGWTARTGRSAIVPDTLNDARHFRGLDEQTGLDLRSILSAPLRAQDKVIGVLQVADTRPNRFTTDDLNIVEPLVGAAATAIMNARLYETAQQEIAERQRAQEALRQQTIELETRNAELDAFAHTVAHDLKNPLGVVMGYAEMLDIYEATYTPEDRKEVAVEIVRATQKMNNIIQELLLLSEVRKAEVELSPLNMGVIADEARRRLVHMLQTHRAEIRVPEPSAWPVALGYAPWVEEVWVNYLSNAIKYGGRGDEPPLIELGAETQADGMLRFWVHDHGSGIAPEDQARLFTPFTRLDQVRAAGHGLGLSIVRRIAEKLGGGVSVDSQMGEGSTFSFTLAAYAPWFDEQGLVSPPDG